MAEDKNTNFTTWSGLPVREIYTPKDIPKNDENLGEPGEFPYTRGIHKKMYRDRLWITRELCGVATPSETNARLKYLIKEGQSGLALVPDTPTQMGLDSDHPMSVPSVGVQGVPLCCLSDMGEMLDGIQLDEVTTSISVCSVSAPVIVAQFFANAQKLGYDAAKLRGSVQNDPLQAMVTGYDPGNPFEMNLKLAIDTIEFCSKNMPSWHCTTVNAYDFRETGISAVQEIAFAFSTAITYIVETLKRGLTVEEFVPRILIISGAHIDLFEEVAKFRAARRVWAKIIKNRFKSEDKKSQALKIAVHTSGSSLTAQQPINNVIRAAYQAMAAVLGGCQGLDLSSYDEGICTPSEEAAMVSLRTQQILAHETGVANTVDPLGGSYYVESLTNQLEEQIEELISKIDEMGGMAAVFENGWLAQEIEAASLKLRREIDTGERVLVGVNSYQIPKEKDNLLPIKLACDDARDEQINKIKEVKSQRDEALVKEKLNSLYQTALKKQDNLMPLIIECTKANATIGEILGTVRMAYGKGYDPLDLIERPFPI